MRKIILASQSPRRQELLGKFNIDFEIRVSDLEEKVNEGEDPKAVSMALAYEKAIKVARGFSEDALVISADTLVVMDGEILGKPRTREEAEGMMRKLSGNYHQVITGLALVATGDNKKIVDYERTQVKFRNLDEPIIKSYLDSLEYRDKAGGYGIQGLGSVLVERIEGCYFNVMGLPLYKLDILLRQNFKMKLL